VSTRCILAALALSWMPSVSAVWVGPFLVPRHCLEVWLFFVARAVGPAWDDDGDDVVGDLLWPPSHVLSATGSFRVSPPQSAYKMFSFKRGPARVSHVNVTAFLCNVIVIALYVQTFTISKLRFEEFIVPVPSFLTHDEHHLSVRGKRIS